MAERKSDLMIVKDRKDLAKKVGELVLVDIAGPKSKYRDYIYEGEINGMPSFIEGHFMSSNIINSWRTYWRKLEYKDRGILFTDYNNRQLIQYEDGSKEFEQAKKLLDKNNFWNPSSKE